MFRLTRPSFYFFFIAIPLLYATAYGLLYLSKLNGSISAVTAFCVGTLLFIISIPLWLAVNNRVSGKAERWLLLLPLALLAHAAWFVLLVYQKFGPDVILLGTSDGHISMSVYFLICCGVIVLILEGANSIDTWYIKLILMAVVLVLELFGYALYALHLNNAVSIRRMGGFDNIVYYERIEIVDGQALVTVPIQGDTLRLLIDTGAGHCIIDQQYTENWGMDTLVTIERYDYNGRSRHEFLLRLPELVVFDGLLREANVPVVASDYTNTSFRCRGIDGILGTGFLSRFN